jgi:hypothetical protein
MALPAGIDLSSLLTPPPTFHPMPVQQQQQNALTQQAKPKRKAKTADQKREQKVLDILAGKDKFNLLFVSLVVDMDEDELNKYVAYVKQKNGIPA